MNINFKLLKHQKEFLTAKEKFVCMLCGRGSGKTYIASLLCAIKLIQGKRLIVFAQTAKALEENLMAEIVNRLNEIIPRQYEYNKTTKKITYKNGTIFGFSYENIEACRGFTEIEIAVFDEIAMAPANLLNVVSFCLRGEGINPQIFCMTTPRIGSWFNRYVKEHNDIKLIRATIFENKYVSEEQIEMMKRSVIDENMLKQELYGEIVEDSSNGVLFTNNLLDTAFQNVIDRNNKTFAIGIDCSGLGRDNNAIVVRQKTNIAEIIKIVNATDYEMLKQVKMLVEKYGMDNLSHICIDEAFGLGLNERLQETNFAQYVSLVPFAGSSPEQGYANNRAYIYCRMKKDIEENGLLGLNDEIKNELNATRYILNNSNKIQLIPKDEIKMNIGRSPDVSDALALTYYSDMFPKSLVSKRKERQKHFMD